MADGSDQQLLRRGKSIARFRLVEIRFRSFFGTGEMIGPQRFTRRGMEDSAVLRRAEPYPLTPRPRRGGRKSNFLAASRSSCAVPGARTRRNDTVVLALAFIFPAVTIRASFVSRG